MLNPDDREAPPNFMEVLYGDDDEDEDSVKLCISSDEEAISDEEGTFSPLPPPFSPLTPPTHRDDDDDDDEEEEEALSGDIRPRSPLRASKSYESGGVLFEMINVDGTEVREEDFLMADAHVVYERSERVESESEVLGLLVERGARDERSESASRARSVRGRAKRGRGRPYRGGRGGRLCRQARSSWQPGQPLTEIWLTDEDVPQELREMVRDVMRRRQARVQSTLQRRSTHVRNEEQNYGDVSESMAEDIFYDATDGTSYSRLEGEDLHFEWSPMETFRVKEETFIPERTGSVALYTNPYDAFRSYWDDSILQIIVNETNRYAEQISSKSASFRSEWYDTNVHELLCLFAFWMMTGIIRMPTIHSYFSTNSLLKAEVFSSITTLKRYKNLNRALHFVDTSANSDSACPTNSGDAIFNRVHRLRPIIDHINLKFQSNYVLSKDICIDESLLLWKGRLNFKQYIRSKAAKFGIKTFELCESATGYLWSFLVYTGKDTFDVDSDIPKSTAYVLKLIKPLLNKGYRLFMDNWFNSPLLARFLKRNGTDCVGVLRSSRVDVPRIVTHAPLKQGELIARHSGDVCVLSWQDRRRVTMLTTCHGSAIGLPAVSSCSNLKRPALFKPQCILDYNCCMGGVDRKDQMLEPYLLERKRGSKWYLKLFKRLLNASIQNSRILLESSSKAKQDNLKFRLELVHSILVHHLSLIPSQRQSQATQSRIAAFPHKVHHAHWPARLPQTDVDRKKNHQSRQLCVVCLQEGRKTQRTYYRCEACNVPLCVEPCFKKHHI